MPGRIRSNSCSHTRANCAAFFIASAARSIRRMKFSTLTISFRSRELSLSKTAQPCEKSRQKSRSGNLWSRLIVHIWRPFPFVESVPNRRIRALSRKRSRRLGTFHWKKLLKRRPKPRTSFSSSIGHENQKWSADQGGTGRGTGSIRSMAVAGDRLSPSFARHVSRVLRSPDTQHYIVISTREQKLALLDRGKLMGIYPVSTSK